jgi:hypothetical protein
VIDRLLKVNECTTDTSVDKLPVLLSKTADKVNDIARVETVLSLGSEVDDSWMDPI